MPRKGTFLNNVVQHIKFNADNTYDIGAAGANRPRDIYVADDVVAGGDGEFTGDLNAAGGFAHSIGPFYQDNVSASQTSVALYLGYTSRTELPMVRAGSILGIAVYSNEARTAGTLTAKITIDGTEISGHDAVIDDNPTQNVQVTIAKGEHTFTAGQRIGVKITTDGSWEPTTADISATVLVEC